MTETNPPFNLLTFLFSPFGRVNRLGFLAFFLGNYLLGAAAQVALTLTGLPRGGFVLMAVVPYIWACISIKRLHDMGRSGFWILSLLVVPVAIVAILAFSVLTSPGTQTDADYRGIGFGGPIVVGLSLLLGAALFDLVMLIVPGQAGGNRHGPPPAAIVQA